MCVFRGLRADRRSIQVDDAHWELHFLLKTLVWNFGLNRAHGLVFGIILGGFVTVILPTAVSDGSSVPSSITFITGAVSVTDPPFQAALQSTMNSRR